MWSSLKSTLLPGIEIFLASLTLHGMMSADLLAEFAQTRPSAGEDENRPFELKEMPPRDNQTLVDVSDGFNHATPTSEGGSLPATIWHMDNNGVEVLFDASTNRADLDDFGDFEGGEPETAQGHSANWMNDASSEKDTSAGMVHVECMLDQDRRIEPPQVKASESPYNDDEWGDFSTAIWDEKSKQEHSGASMVSSNKGETLAVDETAENVDSQSFGDSEAATLTHSSQPVRSLNTRGIDVPGAQANRRVVERAPSFPSSDESRPSNIPSPAILFQILPRIFAEVAELGHPQDPMQCCAAILQAYRVASHLIAGRALRWKRDNILSQNTKIGPAAAGGKGGGMKLAALDKTETLKEEREIAEVVRAWERDAHLFNSMVHRAGIKGSFMRLSEKLRPRTLKGVGVLVSQRACALCGLKRDERVPEVDIDVDDSFSEFWIEHWGHRDCRDFWHRYQTLLIQR